MPKVWPLETKAQLDWRKHLWQSPAERSSKELIASFTVFSEKKKINV